MISTDNKFCKKFELDGSYVRIKGAYIAVAILLLTVVITHLTKTRLASFEAIDIAVETLPMQLGSWNGVESDALSTKSKEILKLTKYIKRDYTNSEGKTVSLYIGYWNKQSGEHQAAKHSPALCLPSNGWHVQYKDPVLLTSNSSSLTAKQILGEIQSSEQLFYYWFFAGEENYYEELKALVNISLQRLLHGRSDGGIIEIHTAL
jgi:EpsI family protein